MKVDNSRYRERGVPVWILKRYSLEVTHKLSININTLSPVRDQGSYGKHVGKGTKRGSEKSILFMSTRCSKAVVGELTGYQ